MALDPNASKVSIPFNGGSLTATKGLLTALFGEELVQVASTGSQPVTVKSHSRVRVIGGPSTNVAGTSYTRTKYPSSSSNGGAGGEAIALYVDGDWWTARLTGSHQDFNAFLQNATWASGELAIWRSEKGTKYGPFGGN